MAPQNSLEQDSKAQINGRGVERRAARTSMKVDSKTLSGGYVQTKAIASMVNRPKALALDMSTVEQPFTNKDGPLQERPRDNRPMGLKEAPTFYPDTDEFKDPFRFFESISREGQEYGIVKVVPPAGWTPGFAIDSEKFYFRTRRQELNSVEGGNRASLNYMDQLSMFCKQAGYSLNRLPKFDKRPIDLYRLKTTVEMHGGFERCCSGKKWAEVAREMGYTGKILSSLSTSLRSVYQKYLLPYEEYLIRVKPSVQHQRQSEPGGYYSPQPSPPKVPNTPSKSPSVSTILPATKLNYGESTGNGDGAALTETSVTENQFKRTATDRSPRPLDDSDLHELDVEPSRKRPKQSIDPAPIVAGSNMSEHRTNSGMRQHESKKVSCTHCDDSETTSPLLTCESCNSVYHASCVDPPLDSVPPREWHCNKCLVGTGEFGFEDGGTYTLRQFQEKARIFKEHHFANHFGDTQRLASGQPSDSEVEKEFWRLVEDVDDTVEVEYGADIHSTTHGSGFPTIERQPLDPYSADPWNLNVLPLHQKSLFRYIDSDISGMTVPWLYVGMCFSTFCWHAEDHYTYSANYQHFGATKTWYGVPGDDANKFEDAMRKAVPDLFEQQPDLLFQLVTMLSPARLVKENVQCYALDQRPGEFVITFPKAYHAGFNHGFNFNEAVNFAPSDWEPAGRECVERYQLYHKAPAFCHEELLLTAATHDDTIRTCLWLVPALTAMCANEISARMKVREAIPYIKEEIHDREMGENEYQCAICKAFCYLTQIVAPETTDVACLLHYQELSENPDLSTRSMRKKMTDEHVRLVLENVEKRSQLHVSWIGKLRQLLQESPRPPLKTLRTLLNEGERIPHEIEEVSTLRQFVERANEWVEEATTFFQKKTPKRAKTEKTRRIKKGERDQRSPALIEKLLQDVEALPFEAPEIELLKERSSSISKFREQAYELLRFPTLKRTDYEGLLDHGRDLQIDLPEIQQLEKYLSQLHWADKAKAAVDGRIPSLDDIDQLFKDAENCEIPSDHRYLHHFRHLMDGSNRWVSRANLCLSQESIAVDQLQSLSTDAAKLPVPKDLTQRIDAVLSRHQDSHESVGSLLRRTQAVNLWDRPQDREAKKILDAIRAQVIKPIEASYLERQRKKVDDWIRQGKRLFGKSNAPLNIVKGHLEYVQMRNAACLSLEDKPRPPVEPSSREASPVLVPGESAPTRTGREVFCICRLSEAGMMIECEVCHEWYHGKCLKISRGKLNTQEKYTCPICDYRVQIPRDSNRPKLEELEQWQQDAFSLPFIPEELDSLHQMVETAQQFRHHLQSFLHSVGFTSAEVPIMRFYLRKLEGAEVLLAAECNFFRAELHKWIPIAPEPPTPIEASLHTRKARLTKVQKIMQEMGITNPEDLPPEVRQHHRTLSASKKKQEESFINMHQSSTEPTMSQHQSFSNSQIPSMPYTSSHDSLEPSLSHNPPASGMFAHPPQLPEGPRLFHGDSQNIVSRQQPEQSSNVTNLFEALAHSGVSSDIFREHAEMSGMQGAENQVVQALASFSQNSPRPASSPGAAMSSPQLSNRKDDDVDPSLYLNTPQ